MSRSDVDGVGVPHHHVAAMGSRIEVPSVCDAVLAQAASVGLSRTDAVGMWSGSPSVTIASCLRVLIVAYMVAPPSVQQAVCWMGESARHRRCPSAQSGFARHFASPRQKVISA